MNKKGLGQGKLISLFTSEREFLEREIERVLKIITSRREKLIGQIWAQKSTRILAQISRGPYNRSGTNFEDRTCTFLA